jgi:hypothetical protein
MVWTALGLESVNADIAGLVCRFQAGSVQSGSTWQLLQPAFPLKSSSPRAVAALSNRTVELGAGIDSWYSCGAASFL